jgi:hypothetical protein
MFSLRMAAGRVDCQTLLFCGFVLESFVESLVCRYFMNAMSVSYEVAIAGAKIRVELARIGGTV